MNDEHHGRIIGVGARQRHKQSERALARRIAMRTFHVAAVALPLLLGAGAAMAEQATGTVESVDPNTKTVVVNGQPYMIEGQASGLKLDEIKVGEKVTSSSTSTPTTSTRSITPNEAGRRIRPRRREGA